jgi:3-dehydroquinate dehydratase/shikimate dehydrogenase
MICLSTTDSSISGCLRQAESQRAWIDAVELRVDLLAPSEQEAGLGFAALLAERLGCRLPTIYTVRRSVDGGAFDGSEPDRLAMLRQAADRAEFTYLDLEINLSDMSEGRAIAEKARESGTVLIRSLCDPTHTPRNLLEVIRESRQSDTDVVKCAVTPEGVDDLLYLLSVARETTDVTKLLIGMGDYGTITRILTPHFGNLFTYSSVPGSAAAPAYLAPQLLCELYRVNELTTTTPIFAVIGAPITHSESPHYHNTRFAADAVGACYVPILVDDVEACFRFAERLPIRGFSVTIPHKETAMRFADQLTEEARVIKACNTIWLISQPHEYPARWSGTDTDVVGFSEPVREALGRPLSGARALVIGAGGAARGVVYALLANHAEVVITNRTAERARLLAEELSREVGGTICDATPEDISGDFDLVAQATSVGMHGEGDPAEWYRFTGDELVFDVVYTPPETPFVMRAREAGCTVVTGEAMFAAQADAQYRIFKYLALTGGADG